MIISIIIPTLNEEKRLISFEKGENVKDLMIITKKPISKQKTVFVLKPDFTKSQ